MTTTIEPRTGLEVLDEEECWRLLATTPVSRLAVAIANMPDIFPINHVVDRRRIVFRTAEGTKFAASVLGRGVAIEVDGYDHDAGLAWSVVAHGHAREVEGLDELFRLEELPLFPWHDSPKYRWVSIVPDEVSGRRFHAARGGSTGAGS